MTYRYEGAGDQILHTVASTAITAGDFRLSGACVAHFPESGAVGEIIPGFIRGKFNCVAETGVAWTAGDKLYKTAATQVFTKTSTSNDPAGYAAEDKASASAVGKICLHPTL